MWGYTDISRDDFEKAKTETERIMTELGAVKQDITVNSKIKSITSDGCTEHTSERFAYLYNGEYYRVSEVLFPKKPFIVIEYGSYDDVIGNTMADADPFPHDISEEEMRAEVRLSMGIYDEERSQ